MKALALLAIAASIPPTIFWSDKLGEELSLIALIVEFSVLGVLLF